MHCGSSIRKYEIRGAGIEGGMGIVYRAFDTELRREVALKAVHPELVAKQDIHARFVDEARTQARLFHQNICALLDAFEHEGRLYMVQEFVDGRTVRQLIEEAHGPLDVDTAVGIVCGVLAGIEYAHAEGVVHRDIKPSNIMVDTKGRAKIMDFGIAKALDANRMGRTKTGHSVGTPEYMSPEQCLGEKVGPASDIYSLGMTLYEMLTGELPFDPTSSEYKIHDFHVRGPVPHVRPVNPQVPEWLDTVVQRSLAKRREDRFAHAAEMLDMLRRQRGEPAVVASLKVRFRDTAAEATHAVLPRESKTFRNTWALALSCGLGIATILVWMHGDRGKPQARTFPAEPNIVCSNNLYAAVMPPSAHRQLPSNQTAMPDRVDASAISATRVPMDGDNRSERGSTTLIQETNPFTNTRPPYNVVEQDMAGSGSGGMVSVDVAKTDTTNRNDLPIHTVAEQKKKAAGPQTGMPWIIPGMDIKMVWIKPGIFIMGSPDNEQGRFEDEQQHQVTISYGFWMGTHEVTEKQWAALKGTMTSHPELPVKNMSWNMCVQFCNELTTQEQQAGRLPKDFVYRLPTEAEWEYACRAGTSSSYHTGYFEHQLGFAGWYDANAEGRPHSVRERTTNQWGLCDMHGNVSEWCQDWYGPYESSAQTDPSGPPMGTMCIQRGGSYCSPAVNCRAASRMKDSPDIRDNYAGFRIVCVPNPVALVK